MPAARRSVGCLTPTPEPETGRTDRRPVPTTAGAMIVGMFPMAFAGTDPQTMPLAQAVIGGPDLAILSMLFFVPTVFSLVRGRRGHHGRPEVVSE